MTKTKLVQFWKNMNIANLSFSDMEDLIQLHSYAKQLHKIDENSCNGWPKPVTEYREGKMYQYNVENEDWRKRDEKKEEKIKSNIEDIAKRKGWTIELQGDPRGWPMSLKVNDNDVSFLVNS